MIEDFLFRNYISLKTTFDEKDVLIWGFDIQENLLFKIDIKNRELFVNIDSLSFDLQDIHSFLEKVGLGNYIIFPIDGYIFLDEVSFDRGEQNYISNKFLDILNSTTTIKLIDREFILSNEERTFFSISFYSERNLMWLDDEFLEEEIHFDELNLYISETFYTEVSIITIHHQVLSGLLMGIQNKLKNN